MPWNPTAGARNHSSILRVLRLLWSSFHSWQSFTLMGLKKDFHMDVSDRIRPTVVGYFMRGEYVWLKFWQSNKCLKQNTYSAHTFFLPDLSLTSIRKQVYQTHWISKDHVLFLFTRSECLSFSRPMFWGKNPEEYSSISRGLKKLSV